MNRRKYNSFVMSSSETQRQIESVQRDIERLQRQIADISKQEAAKTDTIGKLSQRLAKEKMSGSLRASKQSELRSAQQDVARLQAKRADATRAAAQKTADLHRHQQKLYRQQTQEQSTALARLKRNYEQYQADQRVLLASTITSDSTSVETRFDAFISHAREDKDDLVRPLAEQLRSAGFKIWYDEFQLKVGDSLRRSIDRGLASSRFGIVVLSPAFFAKNWPQYELDGLVAREQVGDKVILPLWHKVSKNEVLSYSPSLVDKLALSTATFTIEELVQELATVLTEQRAMCR
jgi:TIR domain